MRRRAARNLAVLGLRRAAKRLNFDVVWRDYYSPVPDVSALPPEAFTAKSSLPGIDWRPHAQVERHEQLSRHMDELAARHPRLAATNGSYEGLDAAILYATVRVEKPRRIIEFGAGYSSLVMAAAVRDNAMDGSECHYVAVEPYPSSLLRPAPEGLDELRPVSARDFPTDELRPLQPGDIVFIDTTHVVKLHSEVNHLLLEVIPRLPRGVLVHIHDIFLPYEYPRDWFLERGYYWNEQYAVQALLIGNTSLEVVSANHWLQREGLVESAGLVSTASALWLRTAP